MAGIMTSPYFSECVQNSAFQVVSEGTLKAVGRPLFTLADKNASMEAKKYSAMKEFTFQAMSMILYAAAVTTIVKNGGYKLLRKMSVFKDMDVCKLNKSLKDFNKAFAENMSQKSSVNISNNVEVLKKNREFALVKGAMEQIVMIGSGVILTIICPFLVAKMVHPVMNFVANVEKNSKAKKKHELNKIA